MARRIEASEGATRATRRAVERDKERRRNEGLWSRLQDFFTTTPVERAARAALTEAERVRAEATETVTSWIRQQVEAAIAVSERAEDMRALRMRRGSLAGRLERAGHWLVHARSAQDSLMAAAAACSSAATTEVLDAVTSSKLIAAASYAGTASARQAIARAGAAVDELRKVLPKRGEEHGVKEVDDTLDVVVDLIFDPGLDVLSILNLFELQRAENQCRRSAQRLSPVIERLQSVVDHHEQALLTLDRRISELEQPFVDAVVRDLPGPLAGYTLSGHPRA